MKGGLPPYTHSFEVECAGGQVGSACLKAPHGLAVFFCPVSASPCRPEWLTAASVDHGPGVQVWFLGIAQTQDQPDTWLPERSNPSKPSLDIPP